MRTTQPDSFPDLPGQLGLATRAQLLAHGFTASAVRHQVGGRWQLVYPGVLAPHRGPLDSETRLIAAKLWAGPRAVLTGWLGLQKYGLSLPRRPRQALFLVPSSSRQRRLLDVRTVRTTRRVEIGRRVGCVPVARPARCLADLARYENLPPEDLVSFTLAALQQRTASAELLDAEVALSRRNGLAALRRGIEEFRQGAWSRPEAVLRHVVGQSKVLPPMLLNHLVRLPDGTKVGRPDGYFDDVALAVQVHSRQFHTGRDEQGQDRWQATVDADARLSRHGVIVVPVTPHTLATKPHSFLVGLEDTYRSHVGREIPDVVLEPPLPSMHG